jgi:phospholipid/cholesterol/gamma-HCH transport system ATP-binding protein
MNNIDYVINVSNLNKKFGEHEVVKNLSIRVPRGKITTILGFSGAGKSTLLKHLLGLVKPDSGEIIIDGVNLGELEDIEIVAFRRKFGMLFQYAALFDSLTAFENIAFPIKEFSNLNKQEIDDRVSSLLEAVGIEEGSAHKFPDELSGGMRKRVGLARALALNPSIILYDEPTTGLDPITTKMVNDLIKKTSVEGGERELTSIIISHDVKASLEISDYIAFLERGEIVEYLPVEEFKKSENPNVLKFLTL